MKTLSPLIKWAGSKRSQAKQIIDNFPDSIDYYFEPFIGGGSILGALSPNKAIAGDLCNPLIDIWKEVKKNPKKFATEYEERWEKLQSIGHTYYYEVRDRFNKEHSPYDLLFLSRTCVNGLIRFNRSGEFNNSLHHTRKGIDPMTFEKILSEWSSIIQNYEFHAVDYRELTKKASCQDFIYLDPPYSNTKGRYFGGIDLEAFFGYLADLNKRNIKFALSFDGSRGDKNFVADVPKELYKRHLLLHSGNSTFNKVQNKGVEAVLESLYLNY